MEPTEQWAGRWLARLGQDVLFDLLALKRADALACAPHPEGTADVDGALQAARTLLARPHCLSLRELAVNGRDALAVGLSGPAIGRALAQLLEEVSQGKLENSRLVLLRELEQLARDSAK